MEQFEQGQMVRIGTADAFFGKIGTVEQVQQAGESTLVWVCVPGLSNALPFGVDELEPVQQEGE